MSEHSDREATTEAADLDRKARRERGEQVGPTFPVEPEATRCRSTFGFHAFACILPAGHAGGHHYRGRITS